MRISGRLWWASLGVMALALVGFHLPARAAEDSGDRTAWLGVYTQSLTPELRDALGHRGDGVLVNRVVDRSPADRCGIRKGDLIVRVDGRAVDSPSALARVIQARRVGDDVEVTVLRDGERQEFTATLASRSGDSGSRRRADEYRDESGDSERSAPQAPENKDEGRDFRNEDRDIHRHEGHAPDPGNSEDFSFEMPDMPNLPDAPMTMGLGRARLGVRIETLNPDLAEYFDVKEGRGVLVVDVIKDSEAQRVGIKSGDVIIRVDDRDVNDSDDLIKAIQSRSGKVSLIVVRRGSQRTIEADLPSPGGPRVLRLRRGDNWRGDDRRPGINIPEVRRQLGPDEREALRREMRALKEELEELKRDLEELKNR